MPDPYISIAEDLAYFREKWTEETHSDTPPDDELRRGSVALRHLVVDQGIQHAWLAHGFEREPTVVANEIAASLPSLNATRHVVLAEGQFEMAEGVPLPPEGERHLMHMAPRTFSLTEYRESAAIVVNGDRICRREVISYFANVLGGAHLALSPRRRKANEELIRRMQRIDGQITIFRKEALRFELRAIGRTLGNSRDLQALEQRIRAA